MSTFAAFDSSNSWGPGAYGLFSGTSFSAPNVAGSLALMVEYKRRMNQPYSPESLKTSLQNTAEPSKIFASQGCLVDSVISQGSGLHNVYKAVMAGSTVSPSSIGKMPVYFSD